MSTFYELIQRIQKRPSMYLGKPSISNLRSFLAGYILARRESEIPQTEQEKQFTDFQSWIQQKFNISSNQSWDKIILFFSEDEHRALLYFFDLFDEFLASQQNSFETKPPISEPALSSTSATQH